MSQKVAPAIRSITVADDELIRINGLVVTGEFINHIKEMTDWDNPGATLFKIITAMRQMHDYEDVEDRFEGSFLFMLQQTGELFNLFESAKIKEGKVDYF